MKRKPRDPPEATKLKLDAIRLIRKMALASHSQFPDKSCRYCGSVNRKEHSPQCEHILARDLVARDKELNAFT